MRNRGSIAVMAVLAVALSVVLAGCGGGGGGKTVKIVSDLPLQGSNLVQTSQMVEGIKYVLNEADYKAGDYTIEYESNDDAIPSTGNWDEALCASNAQSYVEDDAVVVNIGTYNSGCAAIEIPILNEASLAMLSPANTYAGLTHSAAGTEKTEPDKYYPSGTRNYARVVASDDFQGRVGADFMKNDLGVTSVYILDDKELYGKGVADAFEASAKEIGLKVAGHTGWDKDAPNYTALMTQIKATGADGVYIGGVVPNNGGQLIKDKVAVLGDNEQVKLLVTDGFVLSSTITDSANAVEGAYGTAPTLPADQVTGAGAEILDGFKAEQGDKPIEVYTIYAMAAAQVALDAIERSDGSRESVVEAIFDTNLEDSVIGALSFNEDGDPAAGTEQLFKFENNEIVWQKSLSV